MTTYQGLRPKWNNFLPIGNSTFAPTEIRVLGCIIFPKCLLDLNNYNWFSFCPWKWQFPAMFSHDGPSLLAFLAGCLKFSRIVIFRFKSRRMDCSLNWSYINYGELRCDPVMIALKAMNFKLEFVLLRIMWVFGHFFTCRPTRSQLETFNLIGVNVIR